MAEPLATCCEETHHGLPCWRLGLPSGDQVLVAQQGAHVLSWLAQGRERLYLSPRNLWDGQAAIRGGVPVCFPQFNQRGPLPKHGFARNTAWQRGQPVLHADSAQLDLHLSDSPQTQALWPQAFEAQLRVLLAPGQLTLTLTVHNRGAQPLLFSGALHTYLAVDDVAHAALHGLHGQAEWDSVADVHAHAPQVLRFEGEFDRVYAAAPQPLRLQDGQGTLQIEQSPSWGQSVVWNPGADKCATLTDMPADGYAHMLCVEAAQVYEPIQVPAGQPWQGWQRLTAL